MSSIPRNTARLVDLVHSLNVTLSVAPGIQQIRPSAPRSEGALFDLLVTDAELAQMTRTLFANGHHAEAVEKAYKLVIKLVKTKSELTKNDGSALMQQAFSANSPVLKLNAMGTDAERDEQLGYMSIFAGSATGIRNPRAHEPDWEDTEQHALELLTLANHLVERVRAAEKTNRATP